MAAAGPGRPALLVLAHLRCGDTYAKQIGGFQISMTTVFRYIREVVDLLAATAPGLRQILTRAARRLYVHRRRHPDPDRPDRR